MDKNYQKYDSFKATPNSMTNTWLQNKNKKKLSASVLEQIRIDYDRYTWAKPQRFEQKKIQFTNLQRANYTDEKVKKFMTHRQWLLPLLPGPISVSRLRVPCPHLFLVIRASSKNGVNRWIYFATDSDQSSYKEPGISYKLLPFCSLPNKNWQRHRRS